MFLPKLDIAREPDVQVILKSNPGELKRTYMNGPADVCIEIVSLESGQRDHGAKFEEYEQGGVGEYWIVDPLHRECRFYALDEAGRYAHRIEDAEGIYRSPRLPGLALHVPTLWNETLPTVPDVLQSLQAMLNPPSAG